MTITRNKHPQSLKMPKRPKVKTRQKPPGKVQQSKRVRPKPARRGNK